MRPTIEYFLVPNSPWTYLGHQRLRDIAALSGATIEPLPFDLGGQVFPISGGLPLAKRAPQRQAYRLVELQRFSQHLGVAMNLQPAFFPVNADEASRVIIAVHLADGPERALDLAGAAMRAVWAEQRNLADPATLAALLAEQGLPAQRLTDAGTLVVAQRFQANTARAIERGVFGAPSYVIGGELFWGQDRLDFVERKLAP
ncbi:MAG: 2-hydroxychromene-2-carboxylate isomerase [Ideonella sp.]|jgi:2-hydroxychromene-2-carboxylate isomerase|nr:2-hydroxychromene-2-carboxylate isomerase [Ideonella sp.]MBL0151361.1 2-hydroxychromene-2-carboxylate isomerase [Ideonella sp.]